MSLKVLIVDMETKRSVVHEDQGDWSGDYMWSDGNYACDCNRHLLFARALGDAAELEAAENRDCSDGRFMIAGIWDENGELAYSEFDLGPLSREVRGENVDARLVPLRPR